MGSYIVSIAQGQGVYRHIRISREAKLLDLHKAIVSAFKLEATRQPSFSAKKPPRGQALVKYSTNRTKTTIPMREIALKDTGFSAGDTLVYSLASPRLELNCRVIRTLEEPTSEPLVVRASGAALGDPLDWDDPQRLAVLRSMTELISLPNEHWPVIRRYFQAAANLFGVVPMEIVHQLYCRDEPEISLNAFSLFGVALSHAKQPGIQILNSQGQVLGAPNYDTLSADYVVEHLIMDTGGFERVRSLQRGKPWYLPAREELLRYAEDDYFEKTIYYERLASRLEAQGMARGDVDDCMFELCMGIKYTGADGDGFLGTIGAYGVRLKSMEEANSLLKMYTDLCNNTRLPINCGHTPYEMRVFQGKPTVAYREDNAPPPFVRQTPEGQLIPFPAPGTAPRKPGRNDPCPCGSGKKYKRCCGAPGAEKES